MYKAAFEIGVLSKCPVALGHLRNKIKAAALIVAFTISIRVIRFPRRKALPTPSPSHFGMIRLADMRERENEEAHAERDSAMNDLEVESFGECINAGGGCVGSAAFASTVCISLS